MKEYKINHLSYEVVAFAETDSTKSISVMLGQMKSSMDIVIRNTQHTATITQEQTNATQSITVMITELQQISDEMLRSAQAK